MPHLLPRFIRSRRLRWPFWTSTVVAVLLLAVMAGSYWYTAGYSQSQVKGGKPAGELSRLEVGVWRGSVGVYKMRTVVVSPGANYGFRPVGWKPPEPVPDSFRRRWYCSRIKPISFHFAGPGRSGPTIPLYLLAAPFALFSAFLFYRAPIIHTPNHCQHCNYDMSGINATTCPECGKAQA